MGRWGQEGCRTPFLSAYPFARFSEKIGFQRRGAYVNKRIGAIARSMTHAISTPSRRGSPDGQAVPVNVRLAADAVAALDEWRRAQPDIPTRPEALRRLALSALGMQENRK